jgi:hypothetical protein
VMGLLWCVAPRGLLFNQAKGALPTEGNRTAARWLSLADKPEAAAGAPREGAPRVCPDPLPAAGPARRPPCVLGEMCSQSGVAPRIAPLHGFNGSPRRRFGVRHEGATGAGQTLEEALDVGITPMTGQGA